MKRIYFLFILIISLVSCVQNNAKPITELSQNDVENGILIDVRTPEEYREGHIDNAVNVNWFDRDFEEQVAKVDKDKTIYLYCKLGGRSAKAAKLLKEKGYKVVDLEGGYETWKRE